MSKDREEAVMSSAVVVVGEGGTRERSKSCKEWGSVESDTLWALKAAAIAKNDLGDMSKI